MYLPAAYPQDKHRRRSPYGRRFLRWTIKKRPLLSILVGLAIWSLWKWHQSASGGDETIQYSRPTVPKFQQHVQERIEANHDNEEEFHPQLSYSNDPAFPDYSIFRNLDEEANYLPDIVHIPFEEAVEDIELAGWEDEWVSSGKYDRNKWGNLTEPKIDFIYTWVNGSQEAFRKTMHEYELNSTLNDAKGVWLKRHGVNRYRDWDELRYSIRSVEKYAKTFRNKIQILVNNIKSDPVGMQVPSWLTEDSIARERVQLVAQDELYVEEFKGCMPTFNSLTIENQIYNTKSDVDRMFALSDDMLLGKPHSASDIYSPLFGPTMGFKSNRYSSDQPTDHDLHRFGEKPFLIYTSWLLNRRFGTRKRSGQVHFGHSISRSLTREAMSTFPSPSFKSACMRFRGEGFQLYSWYAVFHYTIERHREALLWSYIMLRSDKDSNGNLGWTERQRVMTDLEEGMTVEGQNSYRERMYYKVNSISASAGLEPPKVHIDNLWTSADGPFSIREVECREFNVDECLAPGFSSPMSDAKHMSHSFSTAAILERLASRDPLCGDCLLKLILNRAQRGLEPLLPEARTQSLQREMVVKAVMKYKFTVVEPDALFVMVTDSQQIEDILIRRLLDEENPQPVGQICMNDDVATDDEDKLLLLKGTIKSLFEGMFPDRSPYEKSFD